VRSYRLSVQAKCQTQCELMNCYIVYMANKFDLIDLIIVIIVVHWQST